MVVLDFDGTLADTKKSTIEAFQKTFRQLNLPPLNEKLFEKFIGLPLESIFKNTTQLKGESLKKAIKLYRKNYDKISQKSVRLFPEVKETLEKLKQQRVKIVLVSNKGEGALKKLLSYLEIDHYFSLIIGEEKMKEKKPSPFVIKEILKKTKT